MADQLADECTGAETAWKILLQLVSEPPVGEWYTRVKRLASWFGTRRGSEYAFCRLLRCTHACPVRLFSIFSHISLYANLTIIDHSEGVLDKVPLRILLNKTSPTAVRASLDVLRQRPPNNIEITYNLSCYIVKVAFATGVLDFVGFFLAHGLHAAALCDAKNQPLYITDKQREIRAALLQLAAPRLRVAPDGGYLLLGHLMREEARYRGTDADLWPTDLQNLVDLVKLTRVPPTHTWKWNAGYLYTLHTVALAARLIPAASHVLIAPGHSCTTDSPTLAAVALGDKELLVRNALMEPRKHVCCYMFKDLTMPAWARNTVAQTLALPVYRVFNMLPQPTQDLVRSAVKLKAQLERSELHKRLPRLPYEVWELIWQMLL
jgi:hypothetical protein